MDPSASTVTTSDDLECMLLDNDAEPRSLALSLLLDITNGFSDDQIIGRGGFGVVYKGILENGTVAVKRLLLPHLNEKEYRREVECLMMVRHKNIARFLGYCANTEETALSYQGKFIMADVQQRLLCFEYIPNGSLCDYITDASSGLPWSTRFEMINGICKGLDHLHENHIVHQDLKPANILLDDKMVPKIADFGTSRCFGEMQTHATTKNLRGTFGYLAPEFTSGFITYKFDLYGLGVIIMEILTGEKGFHHVELVIQSWSNCLEKLKAHTELEQIAICAQIGNECMDLNPMKRPDSIKHIIDRLHKTESTTVTACSSKLLEACPLVLLFPFEPHKLIPCSLRLTNDTKKNVAFQLRNKNVEEECYIRVPQYGVVPPGSVYTLVLIMENHEKLPEQKYANLILESSALEHEALDTFEGESEYRTFFEDAKGTARVVQEMTLKAISTLQEEMMSKAQVLPGIKISYVEQLFRALHSLDTDPTRQWIITGEVGGRVCIWNYRTKMYVDSFKVSVKTVSSIKFIVRKKWFLAGSEDGFICVYKYETKMENITRFKAGSCVISLAVHQTQPYVLSSLAYGEMKLWDWDKGWKCIQTFKLDHIASARQVAFNPVDPDCFASASDDHTIKVWSLDSPKPSYTLCGHSEKVNCLYFFTHDDKHHLITGSDDQSAKIWDLQKKTCVCTLKDFVCPVIFVIAHPSLLVIATKDGTVYLWRTTTSRICLNSLRLMEILNIGGNISEYNIRYKHSIYRYEFYSAGAIVDLTCLEGPTRIVIGLGNTIIMTDIDNGNHTKELMDYSEPLLTTDSGPGDTDYEVFLESRELLHVQPLELCFRLEEPNKRMLCWLYLTNSTDEHVAFRLSEQEEYIYTPDINLPLQGIVPPRCTYTLGVTAYKDEKLAQEKSYDLTLESSILGDNYIHTLEGWEEWELFFWEAQMKGPDVPLKAVICPRGETSSEIMWTGLFANLDRTCCSLDVHPTEPWTVVVEDHLGTISLWNSDTKCKTDSSTVFENAPVEVQCSVVTFIARKEWFIVGTSDGFIHVFNYKLKIQIITSFRAHDTSVKSLIVHPTKPYVLSTADADNKIRLWNWNDGWEDFVIDFKGWECIQIFHDEHSAAINQIAIDPKDTNRFASASDDHTIKLWSLDSPGSNYTLFGHLDKVNSLSFFTRDDQLYLITGSDDLTAKIWHIQKRTCVHTLEVFRSPNTYVFSHPDLPVLLTVTLCGSIYLWCSTSFRLKRVLSFGTGHRITTRPMRSKRVVIGEGYQLVVVDIDNEEQVSTNCSKENP